MNQSQQNAANLRKLLVETLRYTTAETYDRLIGDSIAIEETIDSNPPFNRQFRVNTAWIRLLINIPITFCRLHGLSANNRTIDIITGSPTADDAHCESIITGRIGNELATMCLDETGLETFFEPDPVTLKVSVKPLQLGYSLNIQLTGYENSEMSAKEKADAYEYAKMIIDNSLNKGIYSGEFNIKLDCAKESRTFTCTWSKEQH
ncbi:hypothetical protein F7U66_10965 [Vibrio parahaemolyticus]|nr:hypothetical protein [Vibrio parahaemolyticus]